jgi:hypothetical protein
MACRTKRLAGQCWFRHSVRAGIQLTGWPIGRAIAVPCRQLLAVESSIICGWSVLSILVQATYNDITGRWLVH